MARDRKAHRVLAADLAPFAGAAVLAWVAVLVSSKVDWTQYTIATGLLLGTAVLATFRLADRRSAWVGVVPASLVFLAAVGVLRNSAGGINSGAGALALVPVFYTALHARSRRAMVVVLVGLAIFYLAPILLFGAPKYPDSQYRAALLSVAVSSIIGFATQALVRDVRRRAREAQTREHMLEQVSAAVHGLYDSPQVRIDACEAARAISSASVAVIYEPDGSSEDLSCTGAAGFGSDGVQATAKPGSAAHDAFRSGQAKLITEGIEKYVGSIDAWIAGGRPTSVLYQPLTRGGATLGVLVVGWPDEVRVEGPRATVAALLAHEAAAVISRADTMDDLADAAQTDSLTGLPNRRAWDAEVAHAMANARQLTVAMLDLDHFKEFNDTFGHPAGDRLLKETAAAWRGQLRPGDVLARVGGEEFALLLDCNTSDALDVVERLRATVSEQRTCSAGVATRRAAEGIEALMTRADEALYVAKTTGRDRTCVSPASESALDPRGLNV